MEKTFNEILIEAFDGAECNDIECYASITAGILNELFGFKSDPAKAARKAAAKTLQSKGLGDKFGLGGGSRKFGK